MFLYNTKCSIILILCPTFWAFPDFANAVGSGQMPIRTMFPGFYAILSGPQKRHKSGALQFMVFICGYMHLIPHNTIFFAAPPPLMQAVMPMPPPPHVSNIYSH
jgi:hypothetical protein